MQAMLDACAMHPNATLADLYGPLTMPSDLVKAHAHLDALVVERSENHGRKGADKGHFLLIQVNREQRSKSTANLT